jgi:hypothetical protein
MSGVDVIHVGSERSRRERDHDLGKKMAELKRQESKHLTVSFSQTCYNCVKHENA